MSLKFRGSLTASVLTALGASVCCVAPLVLLALGIGGAWVASLTALEPFRPWLIAATALFLFLAFRRLYLQPQECEPGATCADPRVRKRQRMMFWTITVMLVALLAVPSVATFFL